MFLSRVPTISRASSARGTASRANKRPEPSHVPSEVLIYLSVLATEDISDSSSGLISPRESRILVIPEQQTSLLMRNLVFGGELRMITRGAHGKIQ
jgi:hypothetical protein